MHELKIQERFIISIDDTAAGELTKRDQSTCVLALLPVRTVISQLYVSECCCWVQQKEMMKAEATQSLHKGWRKEGVIWWTRPDCLPNKTADGGVIGRVLGVLGVLVMRLYWHSVSLPSTESTKMTTPSKGVYFISQQQPYIHVWSSSQ